MRDQSQCLGILFSLGIHGVIASLLIPSSQKIAESEPVTIALLWEEPPQVISQEIQPTPPPHHSRPHGGEKLGNPEKMTPRPSQAVTSAPVGEAAPKEQVRSPSSRSLVTSPIKERREASSDSSGAPQRKFYKPMPKYPWICRKRGQEGRVSLWIQINGEGRVIKANLHKSSGYSPLDKAALNAVKSWIFPDNPRQKLLSISFKLKE